MTTMPAQTAPETQTSSEPRAALPRTAMIGVGSMGGAILAGLRRPTVNIPKPIAVTTRSSASADALANSADATNAAGGGTGSARGNGAPDPKDLLIFAAEEHPDANREAVRDAEVVILGVKPWMIVDVAREIAQDVVPGSIVVSVAAGVPSEKIEAVMPGVRVVRAMPNTPSHIGRGVTGVAGGSSANTDSIEIVRRLFETVGDVVVIDEEQIDDVTAVSGSGPAYLFLYVEEMTQAAIRRGFTPEQARILVNGTVAGAAELLVRSDDDPADLRRGVTSPKGTTEQAIHVLQDAKLGELFDRALAANVRRSQELAAE